MSNSYKDVLSSLGTAADSEIALAQAISDQLNIDLASERDKSTKLSIDLATALAKIEELSKPTTPVPPAPVTSISPGIGSLPDAKNIVWTITGAGQVAKGGVVDPATSGVIEGFVFNGIFHQRIGLSSLFPNGGIWRWEDKWVAVAVDPRPAPQPDPGDENPEPVPVPAPAPVPSGKRGLPGLLAKGFDFEVAGPFANSDGVARLVWDDMSDAELQKLKASGVTCVRVRSNSSWFGLNISAGPLDVNNGGFQGLVKFCKRLNGLGLAAMIHPINEDAGTGTLSTQDPKNATKFATDFKTLGAYLKAQGFAADMIFVETRNEPTIDAATWKTIERQYIDAYRQGWPESWVCSTAVYWSAISETIKSAPHLGADGKPLPRMIAHIHDYTSMGFTHQGLSWMIGDYFHKNLPHRYPGFDGYSPDTMKAEYDKLEAWLDKYALPGFIGEFGTGTNAPSPDRWNWIKDVRSNAERIGCGWAYFCWNKGFSELAGVKGARETGPNLKSALGLA